MPRPRSGARERTPDPAPRAAARRRHPTARPRPVGQRLRSRVGIGGGAAAVAVVLGLVLLGGARRDGGGADAPEASGRAAADRAHAGPPTAAARQEIPAPALARYQRAAAQQCPGLPWAVVAGIGRVETGHGSYVRESSKGAVGPMQFLPETFADFAVDGDGDDRKDVMDPDDATATAARYLCANGGADPRRLRQAIWSYNRSDAYVQRVLDEARRYGPVPELALVTPRQG